MAPTDHSSFEISCGFLVALPGSPGEGLYHLPLAPAELLEEGKPLCCHLMAIAFLLGLLLGGSALCPDTRGSNDFFWPCCPEC